MIARVVPLQTPEQLAHELRVQLLMLDAKVRDGAITAPELREALRAAARTARAIKSRSESRTHRRARAITRAIKIFAERAKRPVGYPVRQAIEWLRTEARRW